MKKIISLIIMSVALLVLASCSAGVHLDFYGSNSTTSSEIA